MPQPSALPECVFIAQNLTKVYGEGAAMVQALRGVDLRIVSGEFVVLLGASGSGKSTIGKTLQQLLEPTSGQMLFKGQDIASMTAEARRHLKQKIQYVLFYHYMLY